MRRLNGLSVFGWSALAWITGGVIGALLFKKHRVLGFALGAVITGPLADKVIEDNKTSLQWRGKAPPWAP